MVPAGSAVTPLSQVSARWTASLIASRVATGMGATNPIELDASLAGQLVVHRAGGLSAHAGAGPAEHLAEPGEHLAQVGHVEFAAQAAQSEWVSRS